MRGQDNRLRRLAADDLAWLGALAGGVFLVLAFNWMTRRLATHYPSGDFDIFAGWRSSIRPEPLEDVRALVTLATPFAVAAGIVWLAAARPARRSLDPLIVAAQVAGIGLLAWAVAGQEYVVPVIPKDYFEPLLVSIPNVVAGILIGLALAALALRWPGPGPSMERLAERISRLSWAPLVLAVLATAIWLLPAVITDAGVARSGLLTPGQVLTHAEDYVAVVNGRTPMVDYIAQYANVLPFAVAPLLAAFHSSLTAFTSLMCVLSGIALLSIFGVFRVLTGRPWAALALYVPFVALALFPWHDYGAVREFAGNYYAMLPDRLFGPFLLAFACAASIGSRRIPTWSLFLIAGLALLNNAEFGTAALIALPLALLAGGDRAVPLRARLRDLGIGAAIGLVAAVALVSAITLVRTGELPNPSLLSYYNRLFLRDSFALLPMPSLGLQWALYATYAAALITAAVRYSRNVGRPVETGMLAFTGAYGLITGMYFVGRSSQFQLMLLFPVWAFCLAVLAWTAARSLRAARGDTPALRRLLIPATAALAGFGVMIAAIDRIPAPWSQVSRLSESGLAVNDTPNAQRFVEANTDPGDHVLIIGTPLDHRLADRAGVQNVSPLNGYISLLSPAEADRSLDELDASGGNEIFEAVTAPTPINHSPFLPRELGGIMTERGYRLVKQDPSTGLRLWRRSDEADGT
jgi:hypothetical protein